MIIGPQPDRRLCVAPMMAWTDRHCRYLHRLAAPHALLFTEMVTSSALLHGPAERLLRFHEREHPVVIQLGGSDPRELAAAAERAAAAGFDEINLNVGCPSPRVRQGRFGACLMREPGLVADCVAAMAAAVDLPVTVKCRLGVDDHDSQPRLETFVDTVAGAGCRTFYVHARKALLNGLSPAQNRTVPPLQYERVYALKARFPELEIVVNGGIDSVEALDGHLARVDGVMIGRAAYHQPMLLGRMDEWIFGDSRPGHRTEFGSGEPRSPGRFHGTWSRSSPSAPPASSPDDPPCVPFATAARPCSAEGSYRGWGVCGDDVMAGYRAYIVEELERGTRLADMTRPVLGLFAGQPGARRFRRLLSDARRLEENDPGLVDEALAVLSPRRSRAA